MKLRYVWSLLFIVGLSFVSCAATVDDTGGSYQGRADLRRVKVDGVDCVVAEMNATGLALSCDWRTGDAR